MTHRHRPLYFICSIWPHLAVSAMQPNSNMVLVLGQAQRPSGTVVSCRLYIFVGYLADLNGGLLDDMAEFQWHFETSLSGNSQLHPYHLPFFLSDLVVFLLSFITSPLRVMGGRFRRRQYVGRFVNNFLAPVQVSLSPNFVSHTLGHRERGG